MILGIILAYVILGFTSTSVLMYLLGRRNNSWFLDGGPVPFLSFVFWPFVLFVFAYVFWEWLYAKGAKKS